MRAVTIRWQTKRHEGDGHQPHGGPEVLEPAELPEPVAGPGEVRGARAGLRPEPPRPLDARGACPARRCRSRTCWAATSRARSRRWARRSKASRVGQRVMLSPGISCGRCRMCLAGEDSSCRSYRILGYQVHGGYAERVRCPAANVIPLPDGVRLRGGGGLPAGLPHRLADAGHAGPRARRARTSWCGRRAAAWAWPPSRWRRRWARASSPPRAATPSWSGRAGWAPTTS